ncbi:MAG: right-handed parallel beta-helix repeat-containing protein [Phycisphaerae bacterium]|nr:right-handed parallel beta-helix repeat-containing protein [Phycisphaerae bacterium]
MNRTTLPLNSVYILFAICIGLVMPSLLSADTYTVINTDDSGIGSLRWAIDSANGRSGPDDIIFDIPGPGAHTIHLSSALPQIGDAVIIDGYTQSGASMAVAGIPAVLTVVLDGSQLIEDAGLWILPRAPYCTVRGLHIQGFRSAIVVAGSHNSVEGNHVFGCRLDAIFIDGEFNTIGGPTSAQRNVVAGNHNGISASPWSCHNIIQGNYVGTDPQGQSGLTTDGKDGVGLGGSYNTVVDNLIAGYEHQGILIMRWGEDYPVPEYNMIERNKIGMNIDGTSPIPNGAGITINSGRGNTIAENLISGNNYHGIVITNDFLLLSIGNRVTANSIFSNGEIGINLYDRYSHDWVTENDPGDIDTGPNRLMNFPVLTSAMATPGRLIVKGTIDTHNPKQAMLEFFANSAPDDATGYGEGEIFLGMASPNARGKFTVTLPPVSPGMWISATATDSEGNTSEFSLSIEAQGPGNSK